MVRWLVVMLAVGCRGTDTDPPEGTDEPVFTGCDISAMAGVWAGDVEQIGYEPVEGVLTLEAKAEIDAVIGTTRYTDPNDPTYDCVTELTCLGRPQLGFEAFSERVTSDTSGTCAPGYAFYQLKGPGELRFEWAFEEFGDRVAWADYVPKP